MQAVILTAGEGTRMRPLTLTRPKTMLPVGGKPILQYNVEALRDAGITEILLIVGYKEEMVKEHFGNGNEIGVNIDYITQKERLGTAHAIGHSREFIKEEFLVLNGDIILDPELLGELIANYKAILADTMMVLTEVDDPSSFGVVEIKEGQITNIVEKPLPGEAPSNLINTGIYVFNEDIMSKIEKTGLSSRGEYEITDSLQMQIDEGKNVQGFITHKKWIDVGRPWELLEINEEFLDKLEEKIEGHIETGVNIEGPLVLGKNSIIRSGTYIQGPVYIGENCDIGPNSYLRSNTYLGNNVNIGNAVEIKNSIIMDKTNVNHLTYVGDSIIGSNCNLAAGTNIANLRFDDGNVKMGVKEDRVDTGRRKLGVIFGDGVKTGINSSFNPGVKVGVNSSIGSGTVIYKDIDSNKIVLVKQEYQVIDKNSSS